MLPENIDTSISLLESDNTQLNLVRWMHQCELMKRYYEADVVFIVQRTGAGFEIIVGSICQSQAFTTGTLFDHGTAIFKRLIHAKPDGINIDFNHKDDVKLPSLFNQTVNMLSRPILWPDGAKFGCICVLNAKSELDVNHSFMLEPFQILLQQELTLYCQTQRIESLSMRDRDTGMLNQYGFIMMAPRQLSLGRRFGAHAGILFFELCPCPSLEHIEERHHRLLGSIIQDTIRTADIAAHYTESQFVVLVFVDSERDTKNICLRVEKLLSHQNSRLKLDSSSNYFSPESSLKLAPMIDAAKHGLKSEQARLDTIKADARARAKSDSEKKGIHYLY